MTPVASEILRVSKNLTMSFYQYFIILSGSRLTPHDSLVLINEIATSSNQKTIRLLEITALGK